MSINHYFTLINCQSDFTIQNVIDYRKNHSHCYMSDELMLAMQDSLNWIDSRLPSGQTFNGLPYHAYAIIEHSELTKLIKLLKAWQQLYLRAPKQVYFFDGIELSHGKRIYKVIERNQINSEYNAIIRLLKTAIQKGNDILYEGI